jgi:hypothetical protein
MYAILLAKSILTQLAQKEHIHLAALAAADAPLALQDQSVTLPHLLLFMAA